eukprot:scaffold16.g72.t1
MHGTRRSARAASRFDGDGEPLLPRHQPKVKYVYRLLRKADVSDALLLKTVYVLWPDDGTWYRAKVQECDQGELGAWRAMAGRGPQASTATLFYTSTNEEEKGADLAELIKDGQIAVIEPRRLDHVCSAGEAEVDAERAAAAAAAAARGSSIEEWEEEDDEGGGGGGDDDDASVSSGDLAAEAEAGGSGARKRRRLEDSDEEVELEEFEKRELLRDASDDEKPLGYRQTQLERQQQRQRKKAAAASPGGGAAAPGAAPSPRGTAPGAAGGSRRRAASAGVAAATAAVRAVGGGAKPAAAREMDEEELAEAASQELLAQARGLDAQKQGSFYGGGRQGSGKIDRRLSGGGGGEEALREKVRGGFKQALELVASEAGGGATAGVPPDPTEVAAAVEAALHGLCGGATKEYKKRFLTLQFNLKDPHNPDLRAAVLRGDIAPPAFVRMTATELANKELAEYRKRKEEEALKMSVLDAEAAARFSTAAALEARDKLAVPASVAGEKLLAARSASPERLPRGGGGAAAATATTVGSPTLEPASRLDTQASEGRLPSAAEVGGAGSGLLLPGAGGSEATEASVGGAAALPSPRDGAGAIDWASIKAAAAEEAAAAAAAPAPLLPGFESFDHFAAQMGGQGAGAAPADEYDPSAPALGLAPVGPEGAAADAVAEAAAEVLRHLFSIPSDPAGEHPVLFLPMFGRGVWEGQWEVPGAGAFLAAVDAVAGAADMAALLGEREPVIRGRLALPKLERFLQDLRHSRSRAVTVGVLRPAEGATEAERGALRELVKQYAERDRTGVAEPAPGVEAYLLPPAAPLVPAVLRAARAAAPLQVDSVLPGGVGSINPEEQMLVVAIHKRDWRPPPGFSHPVKRPRPGEAPAPPAPPASGEPAGAAPPAPEAAAGAAAAAPVGLSAVNIDWASLASALQTVAQPDAAPAPAAAAPAAAGGPAPAAPPQASGSTPPPDTSYPPSTPPPVAPAPDALAAPLVLPDLSGLMALLPKAPPAGAPSEAPAPVAPSPQAQAPQSQPAPPPSLAPAVPVQLPDLSGLMEFLQSQPQPTTAAAAAAAPAGQQQEPPAPPAGASAPDGQQQVAAAKRKRKSRWSDNFEGEGSEPQPPPQQRSAEGVAAATAAAAGPLPPGGGPPAPAGPMGRMQRAVPPPPQPPQQQEPPQAQQQQGPPQPYGPGPLHSVGGAPVVPPHGTMGMGLPPPYGGMGAPPPAHMGGPAHLQGFPPNHLPGGPQPWGDMAGGPAGAYPMHQASGWQQPAPPQPSFPPQPPGGPPPGVHGAPGQQQQDRAALPYYDRFSGGGGGGRRGGGRRGGRGERRRFTEG